MKHTKKLEDFEFTLANWHELDEEEYKETVDELQYYYEENGDYFTQAEFDIYNRADSLIGDAERYYEAVATEELRDMERDERAYLTSECNH
jgi:ADP-glucose pyrophosphorylase